MEVRRLYCKSPHGPLNVNRVQSLLQQKLMNRIGSPADKKRVSKQNSRHFISPFESTTSLLPLLFGL